MKPSADADFKIKEYLCALLNVETVEVKGQNQPLIFRHFKYRIRSQS
jgi:hypothetical protein